MAWPTSQDYNEAIQDPRTSLKDPELCGGAATTNALGMPQTRSGNFADVYEFHCPGGGRYALKCFTREVRGLQQRYQAISDHLRQAKLPFTVDFKYLEKGVRIRGECYPLLKMQWVEGFTLNTFVRDHLDKPATLDGLIQIWLRMARRLREARLAHADLQHGNVLLVPGSTASSLAVKLIDYDGMFIPALKDKKSGEVGHPAYQHPQRLREGTYNAEVDRFPTLVIVTALRCLVSGGRSLWERYDNGDNLLFREADLREPDKSALFAELRGLKDQGAVELVKHLAGAAYRPLDDAPLVEDLLPERKTAIPVAAKPPIAQTAAKLEPALDFGAGSPRSAKRQRTSRRRGMSAWAWVAGGVTIVVLFIGLLAMVVRSGKNKDSQDVAVVQPKPPVKDQLGDSGKPDKDKRQEKGNPEVKPVVKVADNPPTPPVTVDKPPIPIIPKVEPPITETPEGPPRLKYINSLGMEFALVPKGKSWLGGEAGKPGTREVEIAQVFYLGVYEVTQEEWQKVMGSNPSGYKAVAGIGKEEQKRFPVENVSWVDAQAFVKLLNEQVKEAGWEYRLPREEEWEYACRGGPMADKADCAFDFYLEKPTNQLAPEKANFSETGLRRTCKVGSYPPNRLGLYDMHGNVWEWCLDEAPAAAGAPQRVLRGGSWFDPSDTCRAAHRGVTTSSRRNESHGLRLARAPLGS